MSRSFSGYLSSLCSVVGCVVLVGCVGDFDGDEQQPAASGGSSSGGAQGGAGKGGFSSGAMGGTQQSAGKGGAPQGGGGSGQGLGGHPVGGDGQAGGGGSSGAGAPASGGEGGAGGMGTGGASGGAGGDGGAAAGQAQGGSEQGGAGQAGDGGAAQGGGSAQGGGGADPAGGAGQGGGGADPVGGAAQGGGGAAQGGGGADPVGGSGQSGGGADPVGGAGQGGGGSGQAGQCNSGMHKCEDATPYDCSGTSEWVSKAPCGSASLCDAATGTCNQAACAQGDSQCNGDIIQTCAASLTTFEDATACASPTPRCAMVGGAATCVACNDATDCAAPASPCQIASCDAHACGAVAIADGALSDSNPTDCVKQVCAAGQEQTVADDSETPPQDSDPCTVESCSAKAVVSSPLCSGATPLCVAGVCKQCTQQDFSLCTGATPACNFATGACEACPAPSIVCGGNCVDPTSDSAHCGKCDNTCATGLCANSVCTPPSCVGLPKTCGQGEDCCAIGNIPGGSFAMGSNYTSFEQPVHLVTVSSFALDRYEVTVGRFRKFVNDYEAYRLTGAPQNGAGANGKVAGTGWLTAWSASLPTGRTDLESKLNCVGGNPANDVGPTWTPSPAGNENKPINCVNWYEAFAFCIWDGGRLATEAEWEYAAAGGSENRLYPWGPQAPDISRASFNCLADGSAAGTCSMNDVLNVGSIPGGASKFGNFDLAGNVMEWAFDWTDSSWYGSHSQPGSCTDCANLTPSSPAARSNRGGTFYNAADGMRAANRGSSLPAEHKDWRGVRCARNP